VCVCAQDDDIPMVPELNGKYDALMKVLYSLPYISCLIVGTMFNGVH